ncbi:lipase member K-like isoform X2 [Tribolium madens]|uniref:lipase member K-like isoform X2 n=1 Tax=Tribolium madens TaxID=41895 RepID=UPI001CF72267|nr:lipase member K-like isoform X2 [Tribolium madens]
MFLQILLLVSSTYGQSSQKNVCLNLADYAFSQLSTNCWHNPDVGSTPVSVLIEFQVKNNIFQSEIIKRHGFPFESHQVITEDGYKLGLFRIKNSGRPVFLQHGIACTCLSFLSIGNNSLAFKLHNAGYDVWLGNFRGTIYSNKHNNSKISEENYWDFSFYEMGIYDVTAMIEFVSKTVENKQKIIYIGHSMGTTASFVYAITRKNHSERNLDALISLAPVVYLKHAYFPISNFVSLAQPIQESIPMFMTQAPAGTSMKTIQHYSQEIKTGQFQLFDYGTLNQGKYGSENPPILDPAQVQIPVYLLYGNKDAIGDEMDVFELFRRLMTKKIIKKIPESDETNFKHLDFLYGRDINYLYKPLFEIINAV